LLGGIKNQRHPERERSEQSKDALKQSSAAASRGHCEEGCDEAISRSKVAARLLRFARNNGDELPL
jgi:hypothetical protein